MDWVLFIAATGLMYTQLQSDKSLQGFNFFPFLMSCFVGALTALACIELLKPVAVRIGLVDMPGGRKTHANRVPLIGGIAIFVGFCFSLLCLNTYFPMTRGLLTGCAVLVLIGIVYDFRELAPKIRLLGQFLAGILLIRWGHISVNHLGNLFFLGPMHLGIFSNLLILFLVFNIPLPCRKRASVFLGDAGSTFLGFFIAWFAVQLSQIMLTKTNYSPGLNLLTVLWVLAYPLFDLLSVIIYRLMHNQSPFSASRDHLHHLLMACHLHPMLVTYGLFLFSVALGLFGIFLVQLQIPEAPQLVLYLIVFALYLAMTRILHKKIRMKK